MKTAAVLASPAACRRILRQVAAWAAAGKLDDAKWDSVANDLVRLRRPPGAVAVAMRGFVARPESSKFRQISRSIEARTALARSTWPSRSTQVQSRTVATCPQGPKTRIRDDLRIAPKTAPDLQFLVVAGAGFEPATSGL